MTNYEPSEILLNPNELVAYMDAVGFDFQNYPDTPLDLDDGLSLHVGGDAKSHYIFRFKIEGLGLVTELCISDLTKGEHRLNITNHDEHSFFLDMGGELRDYEATQCVIFRARFLAIRLAKQLTEPARLAELKEAAQAERRAREAEAKRLAEKAAQAVSERITSFEEHHARVGETKAKAIKADMETTFSLLSEGERVTRTFLFLLLTGYPRQRELHLSCEKGGQMAWRDHRNNLIDPAIVVDLISKAWEPRIAEGVY
tara:strand:- start:181340 stop:182110 length:771 start_codon:yes stop_codon:yes gene_type:complete